MFFDDVCMCLWFLYVFVIPKVIKRRYDITAKTVNTYHTPVQFDQFTIGCICLPVTTDINI